MESRPLYYKVIVGSEQFYYLKDIGWQEVQYQELTFMFAPACKIADCQKLLEAEFGKSALRVNARAFP